MKTILSILAVLVVVLSLPTISRTQDDAKPFDSARLFYPDMVAAIPAAGMVDTNEDEADMSSPEIIPFGVDMVDAEMVPNDGSGVYVAVLDTGLLPEWEDFLSEADVATELGKGFTHDFSFSLTEGLVIGPLRDDRGFITDKASGHGTHVTSIVTGWEGTYGWVRGVAPKATIIPVLVLDAWEVEIPIPDSDPITVQLSGGTEDMIAAGINYIADLAEGELAGKRVVINMSLGGSGRSQMIEDAIDYAIGKGVIIVASAGNAGIEGMGYPGGLSQVISAGAGGWADMWNGLFDGWYADVPENLKSKDSMGNTFQYYLEEFSSRPNIDLDQKTQDLDVTAPGAWVLGPYRPAFSETTGYYWVSGTSQAAPHVSAIASLVLQSKPDLTQAQMEKILSLGASGLPFPADDAIVAFPFAPDGYYFSIWDGGDYGAGLLQADEALKFAERLFK